MAVISIPTQVAGISVPGKAGQFLNSPLKSLFAGKGVKGYSFPEDLGTSPDRAHVVQFFVKKIIPSTFSEDKKAEAEPGKQIINSSNTANDLQKKYGITLTPRTTQQEAVIALYMPETINVSYDASYDELSLTQLGGPFLAGVQGATDIAKSIENRQGSIMSAIAGNPALTQAATALFGNNKLGIDTGGLRDVLLKGAGFAINPQVQLMYRGIAMRQFQLDFTLTPRNSGEAQAIRDIVRTFTENFLPQLGGAAAGDSGMFFIMPSLFNVQFLFNGKENMNLPKYGDLVLENFNVDYAPNGWAAFSDGSPVQTRLTLNFKEAEILDKNKLDTGKVR